MGWIQTVALLRWLQLQDPSVLTTPVWSSLVERRHRQHLRPPHLRRRHHHPPHLRRPRHHPPPHPHRGTPAGSPRPPRRHSPAVTATASRRHRRAPLLMTAPMPPIPTAVTAPAQAAPAPTRIAMPTTPTPSRYRP